MAREDRHLFRWVLEHERLYLEGVKDGMQLAVALMIDPGKLNEA